MIKIPIYILCILLLLGGCVNNQNEEKTYQDLVVFDPMDEIKVIEIDMTFEYSSIQECMY